MIGKDVMRHLKHKKNTVIRLGEGTACYNIQTINIQQLMKKYAQQVFHEARIDEHEGTLNFEQFYEWISTHKTLYENYYNGFHNLVWEVDPKTRTPKYLTSPAQMSSEGLCLPITDTEKPLRVILFLLHSILVIAKHEQPATPLHIVCL